MGGIEREGRLEKLTAVFSERINSGAFTFISELRLPEKQLVRWALKEFFRDIKIGKTPNCLSEGVVLVSNYPSVGEALRAVLKVGCLLPKRQGLGLPLLAISREEVVTESNSVVGGFLSRAILRAQKTEEGNYSLPEGESLRALRHLKKEGVLWLSPTGSTFKNGLAKERLRFGAVVLAQKARVPLLPMGLVANRENRVIKVNFGEALDPPTEDVSFFDQDAYLYEQSLLVLKKIASLLPPGQRGDFEDK